MAYKQQNCVLLLTSESTLDRLISILLADFSAYLGIRSAGEKADLEKSIPQAHLGPSQARNVLHKA